MHIVCGYPGTGKSTIIELLSSYLKTKDMTVYFTAPTGLAIKGLLSKLKDQDVKYCGKIGQMLLKIAGRRQDVLVFHDRSPFVNAQNPSLAGGRQEKGRGSGMTLPCPFNR